jgi:hypothetical protein
MKQGERTMKNFQIIIVLLAASFSFAGEKFKISEDAEAGTLTVSQGETAVLTYNFGDQLKEGVNEKYRRSCYIHPLFDLDGKALTDDFPVDHYHHRGLFWTWPQVKVKGRQLQTWHPSGLRQRHQRWIKQKVSKKLAILSVENRWTLDSGEDVIKETVTLAIHPMNDKGRLINVELTFEALQDTVELLGAKGKGYGGLTIRGAPDLKDGVITTDQGELKDDSTNKAFKWADLSTKDRGIAIIVSRDHPDYPPAWLLRTSYAGILNVAWPGVAPYTLQAGEKIELRYKILIHRGDGQPGEFVLE